MAARTPKTFSEPPPSMRGRYTREPRPEHAKMVKAMKTKPGDWMLLKTFTSPSAASRFANGVRHSTIVAFRGDRFEARARGLEVYARYVK